MRPFFVVKTYPRSNACFGFRNRRICLQINLFIFQTPPQTFAKNVIEAASLAVHADANVMIRQRRDKNFASKLDALICVENFRLAVAIHRLLQRIDAERFVHGVRQFLGQNQATVPINHSHQIQKSARHRNVGNVAAPHLMNPVDRHIPQ